MNLTKAEIESLKESSFENIFIRRGCILEDAFENGFIFKYPKIIMVTKESISTEQDGKK